MELILFIILIAERIVRSIIDFKSGKKTGTKLNDIHMDVKNGSTNS